MSYKKIIKNLSLITCVILMVSPAQAVPSLGGATQTLSNLTCKNTVKENGWGTTKRGAISNAKRYWKAKVTRLYGNAFSNWNISKRKKILTPRYDRIEGGYRVRVYSAPCYRTVFKR